MSSLVLVFLWVTGLMVSMAAQEQPNIQSSTINLKPGIRKTKLRLPTLSSPTQQANMRYIIVAPDEHRVLLRCENEDQVVECTEGTLQIVNGFPKGFFCERNLRTRHTRITLAFINYRQLSDKTTCEAIKIPMFHRDDEDKGSDEWSSDEKKGATTCECGWSNERSRIVGGTVTKMNEFPLMAAIIHKSTDSRFCGGAIITEDMILTAAHCLDDMKPQDLQVIVGDYDMKRKIRTKYEQTFNVERIIQHEQWDTKKIINDIGLLKLDGKITYNENVGPACMPTVRNNLVGKPLTAMGWGLTQTTFEKDRGLLRKVELNVIDKPTCASNYNNNINSNQICTYGKNKDTCQGDSGGPLLWFDPDLKRYILRACVSYGKKCGSPSPAVNTDIAAYMPWVRSWVQRLSPGRKLCTKV